MKDCGRGLTCDKWERNKRTPQPDKSEGTQCDRGEGWCSITGQTVALAAVLADGGVGDRDDEVPVIESES